MGGCRITDRKRRGSVQPFYLAYSIASASYKAVGFCV